MYTRRSERVLVRVAVWVPVSNTRGCTSHPICLWALDRPKRDGESNGTGAHASRFSLVLIFDGMRHIACLNSGNISIIVHSFCN